MTKINYVSIGDLVRLATKTISDPERVGIQTVLQQCAVACNGPITEADIATWCDKLSTFRALTDTVNAVRAHVTDARSLQVFVNTLTQYVRTQGEMLSSTIRSSPAQEQRPEDVRQTASGTNYDRQRAIDEERNAWDLIRQS